jgi:formate hydrogenlyase subunit 6/NADH:ubiquinone oxidoreductase subunit I
MEIEGDSKKSGECIQCDSCRGICPRKNVSRAGKQRKGKEEIFLAMKVVVLFLICWYFF